MTSIYQKIIDLLIKEIPEDDPEQGGYKEMLFDNCPHPTSNEYDSYLNDALIASVAKNLYDAASVLLKLGADANAHDRRFMGWEPVISIEV